MSTASSQQRSPCWLMSIRKKRQLRYSLAQYTYSSLKKTYGNMHIAKYSTHITMNRIQIQTVIVQHPKNYFSTTLANSMSQYFRNRGFVIYSHGWSTQIKSLSRSTDNIKYIYTHILNTNKVKWSKKYFVTVHPWLFQINIY